MKTVALALGVCCLSLVASAHAHFGIVMPPAADNASDGGKGPPPCGPVADSNVVTPAQGGHPLDLQVDEMIFHPGFYRVALALNSQSELPPDNIVIDKDGNVLPPDSVGLSDTAEYEATAMFPVLADHLWPHDTPDQELFQTQLTLPNVNCDKCTLQVIEFMSNSNSNAGGGYFYHHCANLKITADPALPAFTPPVSNGGAPSGGAASSGASSGGFAASGTANGGSGGAAASGGAAGTPTVSGGASGAAGSSASGLVAPAQSGSCAFGVPRTTRSSPAPWFGWPAALALSALARRRRARERSYFQPASM